jgi:hypothetical protein
MTRKRRGRYIFESWISDHWPWHVHVYDGNGEFLGRVILDSLESLDAWKPPKNVLKYIQEMKDKGQL